MSVDRTVTTLLISDMRETVRSMASVPLVASVSVFLAESVISWAIWLSLSTDMANWLAVLASSSTDALTSCVPADISSAEEVTTRTASVTDWTISRRPSRMAKRACPSWPTSSLCQRIVAAEPARLPSAISWARAKRPLTGLVIVPVM